MIGGCRGEAFVCVVVSWGVGLLYGGDGGGGMMRGRGAGCDAFVEVLLCV